MSIGIKAVCVYRPQAAIDNLLQGDRLDATADFIQQKIGMLRLTRMSAQEETTDLAYSAAVSLFDLHGLKPEQVECLVVVTQNPDAGGLPHSSAKLHCKLGLPSSCAVFDISLGCSGFVHGLEVAKSFMESQKIRDGILVTCDPYSKIIDLDDRDTALLFGDGATATWLGEAPLWRIGPSDFGILSDQHNVLEVGSKGKLAMNGRAVFNFAATRVPLSVKRVLSKAGLEMADIDLVLLHQGSRYIVETLAKRLGAEGKTPFVAGLYGNTVSSSIPMLLAENVPATAKRLMLSGFGVGLAWATCILEKSQ